MPFLLLAQGDTIGLDLLKKLVDNRYGGSPPSIDSIRVRYEGWSAAQLGPFPLRAKVTATAEYRFPFQMRWSFHVRILRFLQNRYTMAFDGTTVYEEQRGRVSSTTDEAQVQSARARVWSEAAYLVSPLIADHDVHVQSIDPHTFEAQAPGHPEIKATVRLDEENALDAVEIKRMDPNDNALKLQRIEPGGGLVQVDGLLLPAEMRRYWEGRLFMTLSPIAVELNPELDESMFRLEQEDLLAVLREDDDSPDAKSEPDDAGEVD